MGLLVIVILIISLNWFSYHVLAWIPLSLFGLLGQGFWLSIGGILVLFLLWSFKE